jgi:hypothetical protein
MVKRLILIIALCAASASAVSLLDLVAWISAAGGAPPAYVPTAASNLVLRWSFTTGSATNVPDDSGNGNYGYNADTNGPTITGGYSAFANNNYLRTVSTNLLSTKTEYTMTMWMWCDSFTTYGWPFAATSPSQWSGIEFDTTASRYIYFIPAPGNNQKSSIAFSTGTWVFVAGGFKTNNIKLVVVDTAFASSSIAYVQPPSYPLSLGSTPPEGYNARGFSGKFDEVRLYNRLLTSNEIVSVRAEGRP